MKFVFVHTTSAMNCKTTDSSTVKPHFNIKTHGDWPSGPDNREYKKSEI